MVKTAIILAAGRGSRLDPGGSGVAEDYSKPLLMVGGKPLLARTIEACRSAGVTDIIVVTGFRDQLVRREAELAGPGVRLIHNAEWQKSNGVSLLACKGQALGPFALMMADHVFDPSILADLLRLPVRAGSVTLAIDRNVAGVFDLDDATKVQTRGEHIVDISKTLTTYDAIDCGLFQCTPAIFDALDSVVARRGDSTLSEGMAILGGRQLFFAFDIDGRWWQDVDTPEMRGAAESLLAARSAR